MKYIYLIILLSSYLAAVDPQKAENYSELTTPIHYNDPMATKKIVIHAQTLKEYLQNYAFSQIHGSTTNCTTIIAELETYQKTYEKTRQMPVSKEAMGKFDALKTQALNLIAQN